MFTINPVTGNRDEIVIEGNFGLGETVVSGAVNPDDFVVDKNYDADKRTTHLSKNSQVRS